MEEPRSSAEIEFLERAIPLKEKGELGEATLVLLELARKYPDYWPVFFTMGAVHLELKEYIEGSLAFQQAADLDPADELSSYYLFLCLFNSGRQLEAMAEMQRYIEKYPSEKYTQIARELQERVDSLEQGEKPDPNLLT